MCATYQLPVDRVHHEVEGLQGGRTYQVSIFRSEDDRTVPIPVQDEKTCIP